MFKLSQSYPKRLRPIAAAAVIFTVLILGPAGAVGMAASTPDNLSAGTSIYLPIVSRGFEGEIDPINRTVTSTAFFIDWHDTNPEEIVNIQWNGSSNLTNPWPHPNCPTGGDLEFFGNSWVSQDEGTPAFVFRSLVGWGTTGTWQGQGSVRIDSSASGCFGTSGIPVQTRYGFSDSGPFANRIRVERRFEFGSTPFTHDFRPYIPRLQPLNEFTQVLHPNAAGTSVVTEVSANCPFGCMETDWDGSWFAIHAPSSGRGLIVRHDPSPNSVALWVDEDHGSFTTSSSVLLLQPGGGFIGSVVDVQFLCFYDSSLWTPSLALPPGC